jgi:hypothetical protein
LNLNKNTETKTATKETASPNQAKANDEKIEVTKRVRNVLVRNSDLVCIKVKILNNIPKIPRLSAIYSL